MLVLLERRAGRWGDSMVGANKLQLNAALVHSVLPILLDCGPTSPQYTV